MDISRFFFKLARGRHAGSRRERLFDNAIAIGLQAGRPEQEIVRIGQVLARRGSRKIGRRLVEVDSPDGRRGSPTRLSVRKRSAS
ncbi:hypothetical protein [Bradyrhizobium sp.]|uniref:hypothetical protein n=1 Tax=Bradyrhizobium sp. TaxID=376 RepID=UPI001E0FC8F0|nr:hypothetical protein [Bradyrhizobium sp.]MBV8698896.1 hypothetical protein [Bradyrhizobium sp.]MBV9985925.1 hypothetical protein [Bradyrhizobium sp.]